MKVKVVDKQSGNTYECTVRPESLQELQALAKLSDTELYFRHQWTRWNLNLAIQVKKNEGIVH